MHAAEAVIIAPPILPPDESHTDSDEDWGENGTGFDRLLEEGVAEERRRYSLAVGRSVNRRPVRRSMQEERDNRR
jgi:hypothetical protein